MKIQELIVKNFGKLNEKHIKLDDGICLFYGENESGKSTLHTFMKGMLFGIERGRGRASVNDTFSLYEPWENPNFYSGSLKFESGGRHFCIHRNFDKYAKKAELICEDDGEELSIADGDLEMILGGLKASGYDNTISVGQLQAEPGQSLASELKNYATNYYATGNSEIDLEETMLLLKNRKKELDKEVKEAAVKKQKKREKIEQEASYVWRDLHGLKEEQEQIEEELEYRRDKEQKKQQEEQEKKENQGMFDELRPNKWRIHPLELLLFTIIVVLAFLLIPRPWNYLVAIILFLVCGIYVWNRMKAGKREVKTEPEKILEEITPEEEKIPLEKLEWELSHAQEELHEKQVQYNNLKEQLAELDELSPGYLEQDKKRQAIQLAMDKLTELSAEIQVELEQRLNADASVIIREITGGKYTRLLVEEGLHMSLMSGDKRIPMEQVSRGTVEQIYFALRMAASELLHEEEYPVILDDTFVFYDDNRLQQTIKWLSAHRKQVLIFTCQKREEELLKELGIPYSLYQV